MFSCELARGPLGSPPLPRHFSSNLQNFITHRRRGKQAANVTLSLPKASPASPRPHPDPAPAPPVFSPTLVNGSLNYSCHLRGFLLLQTLRSTGRAGLQARCFTMETAAMGPMHATGVRKVRVIFLFQSTQTHSCSPSAKYSEGQNPKQKMMMQWQVCDVPIQD